MSNFYNSEKDGCLSFIILLLGLMIFFIIIVDDEPYRKGYIETPVGLFREELFDCHNNLLFARDGSNARDKDDKIIICTGYISLSVIEKEEYIKVNYNENK